MMNGPSVFEKFKQLDFFTKTDEDSVRERTRLGGFLTIFCVSLLLYLVSSETSSFVSGTTTDVLTVDGRRGERLTINVDIYFPSMSCMDASVDVVDSVLGNTIHDATYQIYKQRINSFGVSLAEGQQRGLGDAKMHARGNDKGCLKCSTMPISAGRYVKRFKETGHRTRRAGACCETCDDVRSFCSEFGIPQSEADQTPQCKVEQPYQEGEGCKIKGYLEVPRGKGDFHIAAGKGVVQNHDDHEHHVHQIDWTRLDKFNISHVINTLSFGPDLPNMVNPLNHHTINSNGLAQQIYFIQVVPTTFFSHNGDVLDSNQYSYTKHYHPVQMREGGFMLPGVYFRYDISPLLIRIEERRGSFSNFLTRLCAIIGGIYVALGIVYSLTSNVIKQTRKKKY